MQGPSSERVVVKEVVIQDGPDTNHLLPSSRLETHHVTFVPDVYILVPTDVCSRARSLYTSLYTRKYSEI